MEDKIKALTLVSCAMLISASWAFNSWMTFCTVEVKSEAEKEIVIQQEKTKRMISYDARCAENAECSPIGGSK